MIKIETYNFKLSDQSGPLNKSFYFGVNIEKDGGYFYINLFEPPNNSAHSFSKYLWAVSQITIDQILQKPLKRSDVKWTLTKGDQSTDIVFHEIFGAPHKLYLSNASVLDKNIPAFSIEQYSEEYSGLQPIKISDDPTQFFLPKAKKEINVFAISSRAADGHVFHCRPDHFFKSTHSDFRFMLADRKLLIDRIGNDNPELMATAYRKFSNDLGCQWLSTNLINRPFDTGTFAVGHQIRPRKGLSQGLGITLPSGDARPLVFMDALDLPFIPIAIGKWSGDDNIRQIRRDIGYIPQTPQSRKAPRL